MYNKRKQRQDDGFSPDNLKQMMLQAKHGVGLHNRYRIFTLRRNCFGYGADVKKYCQKCDLCNLSKPPSIKIKVPMGYLMATRPLDVISMDFTLLKKNELVIMDVLSKYMMVVTIKDRKKFAVAKNAMQHHMPLQATHPIIECSGAN